MLKEATSELQPLPPVSLQAPQMRTASSSTSCQTTSWNVLVTEAVASERTKTQALQAELKALRAQMKERADAVSAAEALAASHADARDQVASELEAAQRMLDEARAAHEKERAAWEEERQSWKDERAQLQREASAAGDAEKRGIEDLEYLRTEAKRSKDDAAAVRRKCSELQQQLDALAREKDALSKEKDHLLQRLEFEQAEMIARVDALQQKMSERPCKVR